MNLVFQNLWRFLTKRISEVLFFLFLFAITFSCHRPSRNTEKVHSLLSNNNTFATNSTLTKETKSDSIKGKLLFKIKIKDFFSNKYNRRINSIDHFSAFVPASFYVKNGRLFIPNRLDNEIFEFDFNGKQLGKIELPMNIDVIQFFIDQGGNKFIFNLRGLLKLNTLNKVVYQDTAAVDLLFNPRTDKVLIDRKINEAEEEIYTLSGNVRNSYVFKNHYYKLHLSDSFLFQLSFDDLRLTSEDLVNEKGQGVLPIKKFLLDNLKYISGFEMKVACTECIHLVKLLSGKILLGTRYDDNENGTNAIYLLDGSQFSVFTLSTNEKKEPIGNPDDPDLTNGGYCYYYDDLDNKLYSLSTNETEIAVYEYDLRLKN